MSIFTRLILLVSLIAVPASAQRAPLKSLPQPEVPPAKPYVYPKFTIDTLPNGLRFAVVENHELPLVIIRTAFAGTAGQGGISFIDPPGKQGAWGLTLATLREGTTSRSSAQITDELADLGSEFALSTLAAFTPPWMRATRSTWRPTLALLADIFMNPTFPEAGVTRVQTQLVSALDRPAAATLASRLMYTGLYGAESPYAQYATPSSARGLTRDDLLAMKDKYLRPQNTIIVVAGDITVAEAREAMTSAFGSWERGGVTVTPIVPAFRGPQPTTIYIRDVPNAAQSIVTMGQVMPGRDHADAAAITALAAVLGDFSFGAGSRIYNAVRNERGLSYTVGVQLAERPVPETVALYASLSTPAISTDTAVSVVLQVFRELHQTKPATAAELEFSKQALLGRLPAELERIEIIAGDVLASIRDRLPPNHFDSWGQRIRALTLPEVQAAATKYLDPDHIIIGVAGDRAKIEAPLRALGFPVVVVEK